MGFCNALFLIGLVKAGIDERYNISNIDMTISIISPVLFMLNFTLLIWAFIVNKNFETTARVQHDRGHKICDKGPYKYIIHPAYLSAKIGDLLWPLFLGSIF